MSDDLVKQADAFRLGSRPTDQQVDQANRLLDRMSSRIEELEAKLTTCEKYRDAYAKSDRIGTQAVRELEAKLAKVKEAFRINMMDALPDYMHEMFDNDYAKIIGEDQ